MKRNILISSRYSTSDIYNNSISRTSQDIKNVHNQIIEKTRREKENTRHTSVMVKRAKAHSNNDINHLPRLDKSCETGNQHFQEGNDV